MPPQPKKVVLVSAGQPSLNPRLVKEADALAEAGYAVTVIYAYWNAWGTELDHTLLKSKKWVAIRAGGDPIHQPYIYLLSRVLFKIYYLFTLLTGIMYLSPLAIARSSFFLILEAKKHAADIYIGHNLGALFAVIAAAKKHGKACGFDAEDFHRNEVSDDQNNIDVRLKSYVEDKYLPKVQYLTVSSPLIGNAYQKLYPHLKVEVILNSFPKNLVPYQNTVLNNPIKLFWFSQTVGFHRGIESVIDAILLLPQTAFELHLLGDASDEVKQAFNKRIDSKAIIHFHQPIPAAQIMAFAANFDIGIASESNTPLNRDICLTNKIFTYIQAGLPVLASNTTAQAGFMEQYGVAGKVYINNQPQSIAEALESYTNLNQLNSDKRHNYNLGQTTINWEWEQYKWLNLIKATLRFE